MLGALATVSTSVSRSRIVWRRGWGMARRDGLVELIYTKFGHKRVYMGFKMF